MTFDQRSRYCECQIDAAQEPAEQHSATEQRKYKER